MRGSIQSIVIIVLIIIGLIIAAVIEFVIPKEPRKATAFKWYYLHTKMAASKSIQCREKMRAGTLDNDELRDCKNAFRACDESYGACEDYGYKH